MHTIGEGLFAEIGELRAFLRAALCVHGVKLSVLCVSSCPNNNARNALLVSAGAAARSALEVLSGLEGMTGLSNE